MPLIDLLAEASKHECLQATEYHLGQLKAKLAKLRTTLQEPAKVWCIFKHLNITVVRRRCTAFQVILHGIQI